MHEDEADELIDAQDALAEAEDRLGDVWDELDEIHDLLDMWEFGSLSLLEEAQSDISTVRRRVNIDIDEIDRRLDGEE